MLGTHSGIARSWGRKRLRWWLRLRARIGNSTPPAPTESNTSATICASRLPLARSRREWERSGKTSNFKIQPSGKPQTSTSKLQEELAGRDAGAPRVERILISGGLGTTSPYPSRFQADGRFQVI